MPYARLRFLTALAATSTGALLAVGAFTFGPATERWLGLGVGSAIFFVVLLASATPSRGTIQRLLDALMLPVCLWTAISARTVELVAHGDSSGLVRWLGFSSGAAIAAVSVLSLLIHELSLESDMAWAINRFATDATLRGLGPEPSATGVDAEEHPGLDLDPVEAERWA